jgi:hypothetical protein
VSNVVPSRAIGCDVPEEGGRAASITALIFYASPPECGQATLANAPSTTSSDVLCARNAVATEPSIARRVGVMALGARMVKQSLQADRQ